MLVEVMSDDDSKALLHSTAYRIVNLETDVHMMPQDDWFEHDPDANCPCTPYLDQKNLLDIKRGYASSYVWVHTRIKENKEGLH